MANTVPEHTKLIREDRVPERLVFGVLDTAMVQRVFTYSQLAPNTLLQRLVARAETDGWVGERSSGTLKELHSIAWHGQKQGKPATFALEILVEDSGRLQLKVQQLLPYAQGRERERASDVPSSA